MGICFQKIKIDQRKIFPFLEFQNYFDKPKGFIKFPVAISLYHQIIAFYQNNLFDLAKCKCLFMAKLFDDFCTILH